MPAIAFGENGFTRALTRTTRDIAVPTIRAYVFDAYGTLFDVHSAVRALAGAVGEDAPALSDLWRVKQLEYSWVRTLCGRYRDFERLTEQALDYALARFPAVDPALKLPLLDAYRRLDAYPEARPVLEALKARGARLAILSNGTAAMLADAVLHAGLDGLFDAVLSVDGIARFKTAPEAYALAGAAFGLTPPSVSFQSSNGWDIAGATGFGFRTVWINRAGLPPEYPDLAPAHVLPSLSGLVDLDTREGK